MSEKKNSKKTEMMKYGVFAVLAVIAGALFLADNSNSTSANDVQVDETSIGEERPVLEAPVASNVSGERRPYSAQPRSRQVYDSVETLAEAYVDGSLDPDEARAYLLKVRSLRIARQNRAIDQERLESAKFKRDMAEHELELARLTSEQNELTKPVAPINPIQIMRADTGHRSNSNAVNLAEYRLNSISQHNGTHQARMSYRGASFTVLAGQEVLGGAVITAITNSSVTIQSGSDQRVIQGI